MPIKTLQEMRILVVDDDAFILKTLTRILQKAGVTKLICSDVATEALKHLSSRLKPVDVLISDLNMPELDGIELIRYIGELPNKISLILISGEDKRILETAESIAKERQIDVLGSLQKPILAPELLEMLQSPELVKTVESRELGANDLANELRLALQNHEIEPFYQPQVCSDTLAVVGIEALARWRHPRQGLIPPNIFIPLAEQLNLINELTEIIYQQAFADLASLHQQGWQVTLSVNFSAQCLAWLDVPERVQKALKAHEILPKYVIIEVTESLLSRDLATSLDILTRFRLKGLGLSIDDFGTGFSTMEQLRRIPFNELKVDRSFVHGATQNHVSYAILESSLNLAKKLAIKTVAEGVEDQADFDLVKALGCHIIQGYMFAKPMPMDDLCGWLTMYNSKAE
ncbi:EAL domain-containing response regulator [Shewanella sp. ULN5]|uniref:EAL domain-containing response regulator n=1 Tax=Shewanella sp. ULN5 TaxID=2994678 RepID=UPI00273FD0BA|nr:EAL domain-containing response regulator [Shewanella sp. ULN5]MDP5145892.1 EAL domain-containing response regulator [Shewanella sp. ULN5]